ncbi:hypothetical protein FLACOL7796_00355 [Flavobacterium collinsii]|uniref:Uncharacterized protein n=1 Tax=Flavobacterium collinsii TaxID=1114861 RepID=A0ABM8KDM2_9FLAO|nr:hypothetical protein FLACOL7796_00355 [Flavobacterium collinsii]
MCFLGYAFALTGLKEVFTIIHSTSYHVTAKALSEQQIPNTYLLWGKL